MTETATMNLILAFRVLLVGGFLLVLPRVTRKGLLFGAYVGEARADGEAAGRLLGTWYRPCVMLMVLSLSVGMVISLAGWPVAGNLTGTALLVVGGVALYLRWHSRARKLVPRDATRQAERGVAPLLGGPPKGKPLAILALVICVSASVAALAYALVSYQAMAGASFVAVVFVPSLNLVLSPFLALMAMLTATAKISIRGGSGGGSVEAQNAFRAAMANLISWTALLLCALMTILSVQIVRLSLSETPSLGADIFWLAGIVFAVILVNVIRIMRGHGQGGALREAGSIDAPLTDGLADDRRWLWGLFYHDRDDPSLMVEERFGFGYTLNYGNPTAMLIVATFGALSVALIVLGVVGAAIGEEPPPGVRESAGDTPAAAAATRPTARQGGVGALLADPPPAMTTVEMDAWYGEGWTAWPGRGRAESMTHCPSKDTSPLVDRPLWQTIILGNSGRSNGPSPGAPWLIAAAPAGDDEGPIRLDLPSFARLRGHLGDPAYEHCRDAERIFVVEEVVEAYEPRRELGWWPVAALEEWVPYRDARLGVSLRHPPDWHVSEGGGVTRFESPDWPDRPLELFIRSGAPPEATKVPGRAETDWTSTFYQNQRLELPVPTDMPRLEGSIVACQDRHDPRSACVELHLTAAHRTYVLRQTFGRGSELEPGLLQVLDRVFDSVALDAWPTVTPTPALRVEIGDGPFLSEEEAKVAALGMIAGTEGIAPGDWRAQAELVSEAEALRLARCDMNRNPDNPLYPFPAAVWAVELTGGDQVIYDTYIGAEAGEHICTARRGQPVESDSGPYPSPVETKAPY